METPNNDSPAQSLGQTLREFEREIVLLREEEEGSENEAADRISANAANKDRLREVGIDSVLQSLGNNAPPGYSNVHKAGQIADFITKRNKGSDTKSIQRAAHNLSLQARAKVHTKNISELDRVFLAINQGILR